MTISNYEDDIRAGRELQRNGHGAEARVQFEKVLALEPGNLQALYFLATLAESEKDWNLAQKFLEQALAINPEFIAAKENLIKVFIGQEKWDKALTIANQLMQEAPQNPTSFEMAAWIHRHLGQFQEARSMVEKALALASPQNQPHLLRALAGFQGDKWEEPWPTIDPTTASYTSLAASYHKFWSRANIKSENTTVQLAQTLANFHDPSALTDADMPLSLAPVPQMSPEAAQSFAKNSPKGSDVKGLKVLFAPQVIAGIAPQMATWLNEHGAEAKTTSYAPTYLGYKTDYNCPNNNLPTLIKFSDDMLKEAEKHDVICLDFASSFKYLPYWGMDLRPYEDKKPECPYADLLPLKDMGKKIFCFFWGSDCSSQSIWSHSYLEMLGFTNIPHPPRQNLHQFKNIKHLHELADAFVVAPLVCNQVPQAAPYWDVCFEPELWPAKSRYNKQLDKILTAPTNTRKKNYDHLEATLKALTNNHPNIQTISIQNTPHHQVAASYAQADLGLEQATPAFGLLAIEMMALGLPVIANRNYAALSGLKDDDYFIGQWQKSAPFMSFKNIRELYARLEECAESPEKLAEIGRAGRDYAMTYHSSEVVGKALSNYLAQAVSGGTVDQVQSKLYPKDLEDLFSRKETDPAFKYFDISVPLFCALGKYEYALFDCTEALNCEYHNNNFTAWKLAIEAFQSSDVDVVEKLKLQAITHDFGRIADIFKHYFQMLSSSKMLLDEAAKGMKEAEDLRAMQVK